MRHVDARAGPVGQHRCVVVVGETQAGNREWLDALAGRDGFGADVGQGADAVRSQMRP